MADKIVPCLWFDGEAEAATAFYVSLLPDSRITAVNHSPVDTTNRFRSRAKCMSTRRPARPVRS